MNELEITGRTRTHVVELAAAGCSLHYEAVASFLALRDAAAAQGIDLRVKSGFRDFAAQLGIWNCKWRGERPLMSRDGALLQRNRLADVDMVDIILTWSAIPGGSRHHWGTDLDIYDAAAVGADYQVQLVPAEYAQDGPFAKLSAWLSEHMARFGFFRPYATDRGGVCPEPWHLSYAPVATAALENLSLSALRAALRDNELEGKDYVLERLPEIYTRYLLNVDAA